MDTDHPGNAARANPEGISDCIRRARDGDGSATEQLIENLSPMMTVWARAQLRTVVRAQLEPEDLVQDVWLRILPRLSLLRSHPDAPGRCTRALMALLTTTLRHRVIDVRRMAARARLHGAAIEQTDRPTSSSGPLARALRSERRRLVQDALECLTDRERRLYLDRLFGGSSLAELAAEHGMTTLALLKARQRIRHKLAALLGPRLLDDLEPE